MFLDLLPDGPMTDNACVTTNTPEDVYLEVRSQVVILVSA